MHGMVGAVVGMHLPAHDLAAVQIQNQIQVKPAAKHRRGQIGHIPVQDLTDPGGDVGRGRAFGSGCLGAPSQGRLTVFAQHPCKRGLAGQVHPSSASMGTV